MMTERAISNTQSMLLPLVRVFARGRSFLPIVGTIYILAIVSYVFVWIVDPYALRSWSVPVRLSDHPSYADRVTPLLFSVAARDGTGLVILGGSTSMGYSTPMLRAAFPEADRPVNLSFSGPNARDIEMELSRLETSNSLKRVIVSLDWTLIKDVKDLPNFGRIWNKRPYVGSWHDPVPEYSPEAVRMSGHVLRTGILDLPDWHTVSPDRPEYFMVDDAPVTTDPQALARLAHAADISRAWVTRAPPIACNALPNLGTIIVPLVRRIAAHGVAVDLLSPPYSLAIYSDWSVRRPGTFPGKGGVFANLVSLRRCAVEMTSDIPNVRVHAFDTDASLTGDLSLYKDSAHISDYETYQNILFHIAKGDHVLTVSKLPAFETALRNAVEVFRP